MDSDTESIKSHTESEEDLGCYFLQPASSPYNIIERIHEANVDLYESNSHRNNNKIAKVQFREELVSFEPDSTDEDINSIESDQAEVTVDTRPTILNYKAVINADMNIFDIDEEGETFEEEEVVEDVESECDESVNHVEPVYKADIKNNAIKYVEEENKDIKEPSHRGYNTRKKTGNPREIHCKDHCIEKVIDSNLSLLIKNLDIQERFDLPPLQLIERKCCDKLKSKCHTNLPNYTGLRSEYGLTSRQLQSKEKQAETSRLREEIRRDLLEEYRKRRIQQNEQVFVQWLKDISRRKSGYKNKKKDNATRVSSANSSSTVTTKKRTKRRPKTAEEISKGSGNRRGQKPRPHTTHSCVYIEVPQSLLKQGLNIGNLTITGSQSRNKKLHILALS